MRLVDTFNLCSSIDLTLTIFTSLLLHQSGVNDVFVGLTKKMLETVKPSHRTRSSLANASNNMNSGNRNKADERIDLSEKANGTEASRCC